MSSPGRKRVAQTLLQHWTRIYSSCFLFLVLADLLDKAVAHLSGSPAECFFSPARHKGQWGKEHIHPFVLDN